jgi:sec-independent protein translocase protein TatA
MDIGPMELIIVLAIVVVLFGPGKIAGIGESLGKGIREFRHAVKEDDSPPPGPVDFAGTSTPEQPDTPRPAAGDFVPASHRHEPPVSPAA